MLSEIVLRQLRDLSEAIVAEPDTERECRSCHDTMAAPEADEEASPICNHCAWKSVDALPRLLEHVALLDARIASLLARNL